MVNTENNIINLNDYRNAKTMMNYKLPSATNKINCIEINNIQKKIRRKIFNKIKAITLIFITIAMVCLIINGLYDEHFMRGFIKEIVGSIWIILFLNANVPENEREI